MSSAPSSSNTERSRPLRDGAVVAGLSKHSPVVNVRPLRERRPKAESSKRNREMDGQEDNTNLKANR